MAATSINIYWSWKDVDSQTSGFGKRPNAPLLQDFTQILPSSEQENLAPKIAAFEVQDVETTATFEVQDVAQIEDASAGQINVNLDSQNEQIVQTKLSEEYGIDLKDDGANLREDIVNLTENGINFVLMMFENETGVALKDFVVHDSQETEEDMKLHLEEGRLVIERQLEFLLDRNTGIKTSLSQKYLTIKFLSSQQFSQVQIDLSRKHVKNVVKENHNKTETEHHIKNSKGPKKSGQKLKTGKRKSEIEHIDKTMENIHKKFRDIEEDTAVMNKTADVSDIVDLSKAIANTQKPKFILNATQKILDVMPNVDPFYIQQKILGMNKRFPYKNIGDDFAIKFLLNELLNEPSLPQKVSPNQAAKDAAVLEAAKMTVGDFFDKYPDPYIHFSSRTRRVSNLYKRLTDYHIHRIYANHGSTVLKMILEMNNFHFFPSALMLENRTPGHAKQLQNPSPDRPDDVDPVFVEEFVYFRLAVFIRERQRKLKTERKRKLAESACRGDLPSVCSRCLDDCPPEEVTECMNRHITCKSCLMALAIETLENPKYLLHCECSAVFLIDKLKQILPSKMFARLQRESAKCSSCFEPTPQNSSTKCADCGEVGWRGVLDEDDDIFSVLTQDDKPASHGTEISFYTEKVEVQKTRCLLFPSKMEVLFRIAEGHYLRMMAKSKDNKATNFKLGCKHQSESVTTIEIVINKQLENKFKSKKAEFKRKGIPHGELLGFHGTSEDSARAIIKSNFNVDKEVHGRAHGKGVYFSEFPNFARRYGGVLLLCRILTGREYVGPILGVPEDLGYNSKKVKPTDDYGEQILVDNVDQIFPSFLIFFHKR